MKPGRSWRWAADWAALLMVALSVLLLRGQRERLGSDFHKLRVKSDTYLLPDREQTLVASLGYRSALADLIFGHLLVSQGLHFQERRLFEHVGQYLETITRLDPKFRDPYRYADTLLTLQPATPPVEFYRTARRLQEQGLRELPYDQELWSTAGQFLTYLAPPRLKDAAEKAEYRATGTRYLMRACELIGSNDNIPFHCLTAASLLEEDGNREAARNFLERVLSMSDDPELRELAIGYLRVIVGEQEEKRVLARQQRFAEAWRQSHAFMPRAEVNALFPAFDPARCAGTAGEARQECATSWARWASFEEAGSRALE